MVYDLIGPFDEIFYPAYFENDDYAYRIKTHKHTDIQTDKVLNPTLYRESMSFKMDRILNKDFTKNKWKGNNVLLFGSEGFGIKAKTLENSDFKFRVKMNSKIESLNR